MKTLVLMLQSGDWPARYDAHLLEQALELAGSPDALEATVIEVDPDRIAADFTAAVAHASADLVLVTNSALARAVAPAAAIELDYALVAGSHTLESDGGLTAHRQWNRGSLQASANVSGRSIVLVQPGYSTSTDLPVPVEVFTPAEGRASLRVRVSDETAFSGRLLKEAETVVGIGRGITGSDIAHVEGIENQLGAARAATRQAIEEGNAAGAQKVGETGHSVAPELYLAMGISGANQHMSGLVDSHRIIAINRHPNAPIARDCDDLFVADLSTFLPLLAKELYMLKGSDR